jgi:hypothetical protein
VEAAAVSAPPALSSPGPIVISKSLFSDALRDVQVSKEMRIFEGRSC